MAIVQGELKLTGQIQVSPILLDTAASAGVRIQDGGAEVMQIRDSTNTKGIDITVTASGIQTIAASSAELHINGTQLALLSGGTVRFVITSTGSLLCQVHNTYDIGSSGANSPRSIYFGTSLFRGTTKVLGAQGAAVANPTGGAIIDVECRAQLIALLAEVRTHGIILT